MVFIIATSVYFMTMEPTASWWDASERITAAYKLEVPHPPGAPFFILMGRFFTMLAPSPAMAAMFMNAMSALAASFTVMLLFWIITHLGKRFIAPGVEPTRSQTFSLMGAALVGSMAFCFPTLNGSWPLRLRPTQQAACLQPWYSGQYLNGRM
jgi:hypothetical protein